MLRFHCSSTSAEYLVSPEGVKHTQPARGFCKLKINKQTNKRDKLLFQMCPLVVATAFSLCKQTATTRAEQVQPIRSCDQFLTSRPSWQFFPDLTTNRCVSFRIIMRPVFSNVTLFSKPTQLHFYGGRHRCRCCQCRRAGSTASAESAGVDQHQQQTVRAVPEPVELKHS